MQLTPLSPKASISEICFGPCWRGAWQFTHLASMAPAAAGVCAISEATLARQYGSLEALDIMLFAQSAYGPLPAARFVWQMAQISARSTASAVDRAHINSRARMFRTYDTRCTHPNIVNGSGCATWK